MFELTVHWAHTCWVANGIAGFTGPHVGLQPAGELLRGIRTVHTLQLFPLGPRPFLPIPFLHFVFLPFVGDRSQILGVRGTPQSMSSLRVLRCQYKGLRRGLWSSGKNTGHLQSHRQLK